MPSEPAFPTSTPAFGARVALLREYYRVLNEGSATAFLTRHATSDIRIVTRFGEFQGAEALRFAEQFLASQWRQFTMRFEPEDFLDAGEQTIIALLEITRRGHTPELGSLRAWPANVFGFRGDRVAYFEAFVDRRDAIARFGGQSAADAWLTSRAGAASHPASR